MSTFVVVGFMAIALLGVPIAFAMGLSAVIAIWLAGIDLSIIPQRMMYSVNSFPLMAIPFFMLSGELMIKAGIIERLISFANALVGRVRGGLAHVTMLSGAGLATVSGTAVSDASALSAILVPSLSKIYDKGFATAIVAAAANLGPIIPPSAAMIVYAFMAGPSVSVGGMFMAGVVPGVLITIGFMGLCSWIATRRGWTTTGEAFKWGRLFSELKRSAIVLFMPLLIIGGIIGGAFTATEGSAVSVIYALILGFGITRTLKLSDLPGIILRAAITTAVVCALIAFASVITYLMTVDLMPQKLSALLFSITKDPIIYLLLVTAILFIVGMFLESNSAYIMLVPLLHPIAIQYGIDPLHFGFLFVLNLVIGMLTPPVGVVLFVVCGVTGVRMRELVTNIWPFVALMYAVLLLCLFFPAVVTTLPRAMGY